MAVLVMGAGVGRGPAWAQVDLMVGRITWVEVDDGGSGTDQMSVGRLNTYWAANKSIPWDDKGATSGNYPKELDALPSMAGVMPYHLIQDPLGKGYVYSTPAGSGGQIGVILNDISVGQGWTISGQVQGVRPDDALVQGMPTRFQTGSDGIFFPAMTRDGKNLFVTKIESPTSYKVGWANPVGGGGGSSPLAVTVLAAGAYATPSPDGKFLAYVDLNNGALQQDLVVVSLTTAPGAPPALGARLLTVRSGGRVIRPSWRGDGMALAFSSDGLTPEAWQVFALRVGAGGQTGTVGLDSPGVEQISDTNGTWPAYAPDGRAVAFSRQTGGHYGVVVMGVDTDAKPSSGASPQDVKGASSSSGDCMWASWHQDWLPPSIDVEILPGGDVSKLTSVELRVAADSDPGTVKASVTMKGKHFDPKMETDPFGGGGGGGTPVGPVPLGTVTASAPPYNVGVTVGGMFTYDTTGVAGHADQEKLTNMSAAGTYAKTKALYLAQDPRLSLRVLGRDNEAYCAYPTGNAAVDDPTPFFVPGGPGATFPNYTVPYLPIMARDQLLAGRTGITWWFEDDGFRLLADGIDQPDFSFRLSNFDGDETKSKPVWMRVKARDSWGNSTDLAIPIFIRSSTFSYQRLQSSDAARGR